RDGGVPGIGTTTGKAEALCEVGLGMFDGGAQGGVTVFVSAFGDPETIVVCHAAEPAEQGTRKFIVEVVRIVAVSRGLLAFGYLALMDDLLVADHRAETQFRAEGAQKVK